MVKNINLTDIEYPQQIEQKKQYTQNPNFRANDFERTPKQDKVELSNKTNDITKAAIGVGIVGAIVTLGILGRKGKLGSYIQELLGGAKKGKEQIKESLEKILEKHKGKKLSELTNEEKNKILEALNPENKADVKQKIEAEFETMKDKKVSEVVDSVKNKLKGVKEGGEGTKGIKPENKPNEGVNTSGTEKPKSEGSTTTSSGSSSSRGAGSHGSSPSSRSTGSSSSHTSSSSSHSSSSSSASHSSRTGSSRRTSSSSSSSRKAPKNDGEAILDAQEKEILEAKRASDARNNKWVRKQHEAKEKEYSDFWNKALSEREAKFDEEAENKINEILQQISKNPNFCDRNPQEVSQELCAKMAEHFKTVNTATMSDEAKFAAFLMSTSSGMKEAEVKALVEHLGLDRIMKKTEETLTHNGKTVKAIFKGDDIYILSDGSFLRKNGKNTELASIKDMQKYFEESIKEFQSSKKAEEAAKIEAERIAKEAEEKAKLEAEKAAREAEEKARLEAEKAAKEAEEKARLEAEKAAKEAEEKARRIEEGRQKYAEYNEKLDGRTSVKVSSQKSEELTEMGKYYHDIELAEASKLKRQLADQAEKMKWFDSYLQDEPLRKVLGIADDAEIMFSRELSEAGRRGRPYIKNSKGNILTYDRNTGIWNEWNVTTIENWGEEARKLSQTKNADGFIVTRTKNKENHTYDYVVRNLETGKETTVKDGKLYKKFPDGKEEVEELTGMQKRQMSESFDEFFNELKPTAPKRPPYGSAEEPPAAFVTVKNGKKQRVLNDIEAYVHSFDEGTFQRVNKNVVVYNANGEREVINIIYEGKDCDIDAMGRILPKLKVDPMIRRNTATVSSSSYNSQRVAQRNKQRQMVHA